MVRRSTWILLVVFAVLVGFTWFYQRNQANKANNAVTSTPTVARAKLYDIDSTQVKEITISDSFAKQIVLDHDPVNNQWVIKDVPPGQTDSFQVESIIAQLLSLQIDDQLGQSPPLESIGLAVPVYTITITKSDDSQFITYVGTPTPIASGYYIKIGTGPVLIVDKTVMDNVVNMVSQPPLIPTATPEITPTETSSPVENGAEGTPTP